MQQPDRRGDRTSSSSNRDYSDLPRKHKITISACPHQCNAPEIHCIALIGAPREAAARLRRAGRRRALHLAAAGRRPRRLRPGRGGPAGRCGRSSTSGGSTSSTGCRAPRRASSSWSTTSAPRPSAPGWRSGWAGGWRTARCRRRRRRSTTTPASTAQKQPGLFYAGFPVHLGLMNGEQPCCRLADLVESWGGEHPPHPAAELHPRRHPRGAASTRSCARSAALGFPLDGTGLRGASIACTGDPLLQLRGGRDQGASCRRSSSTWRRRFGEAVEGLRLNLDGCPHACAHHWIGDIGLQGTTLRERGPAGEQHPGLRPLPARRARPGTPRSAARSSSACRATEVPPRHRAAVPRLPRRARRRASAFQQFFTRHSDEELSASAIGQEAAMAVSGEP